MNLLEGRKGGWGGGERVGGDGGRVGERGRVGREGRGEDDCYTYSNRYVQ